MYAEFIFETGSKSVGCYEDEAEVLRAAQAHHERAIKGETGIADGAVPAERIHEIHLYDKHPDDFNPDQVVSADEVKATLDAAVKDLAVDGSVNVLELAARVRDLSSPVVSLEEAGPQDSMYKMKADKVLTGGWEVEA